MDTVLITLLEKALKAGINIQPVIPSYLTPTMTLEGYVSVRTNPDTQKELLGFLKEQELFQLFNGGMLNFGNYASKAELSFFAEWLLRRTKEVGAKNTVEGLKKYLELEEVPGFDILLISGVEVDQVIPLENGIELKPVREFAWIENRGLLMGTDGRFPQPSAALICPSSGGRKYRHENFEGEPSLYKSRLTELLDACWCLTLVGPTSPLPFAHTWRGEDWVPLSNMGGSFTLFGYEHGYYGFRRIAGNENIQRAKKIHSSFVDLSDGLKDRIRLPMERINKAMRRASLADRCIELGIALESLFLPQKGTEIAFQFRLRGSWFLGGDSSKKRKDVYALLKVLYDLRSSAVHSGRVREVTKMKGQNLPTIHVLEEGLVLAIEAVEKFLEQKKEPIWDDLILDWRESEPAKAVRN